MPLLWPSRWWQDCEARQPSDVRYSTPLHELFESVRRVGLFATAQLTWARLYDGHFDRKYGLDTAKRHELDELELESAAADRGQMYQPTGVLAFRKILKQVKLPEPGVFVDYGCGKGRTLALAATRGFERVVGIEFSRELCDVAEANLERFVERTEALSVPEVLCSDVVEYEYRGDENILYFFYPFDSVVMERVVAALERSLASSPREAVVIYYYAMHREALDRSEVFALDQELEIFGYTCLVYRNRVG